MRKYSDGIVVDYIINAKQCDSTRRDNTRLIVN